MKFTGLDDIEKRLFDYTLRTSNYDVSRDYISLSHCAASVDELVAMYQKGFADTIESRLLCYKGYQMELDLVNRLVNAFGNMRIKTDVEISEFGGRVKGHPDFTFDYYPGDCKSVLMNSWIPEDRLPRKVFWQMQAYMRYLKKDRGVVIYESRELGIIKVFIVNENHEIQEKIHDKLQEVLTLLR